MADVIAAVQLLHNTTTDDDEALLRERMQLLSLATIVPLLLPNEPPSG